MTVQTPITNMFDYEVFGLRVRSELALPELFPPARQAAPEVVIRRCALPPANGEAGLSVDGDALILTVPEVARFRIVGGSEILVDAEAGVPETNVRLYLLGSAFGALLHQRGLLPLHANAIEIDGKAVAFMGESGSGKSTLAAWFHDRGYRVIADDVCVVGFDEQGRPFVAPGLPRLRLWGEALTLMGWEAGGLSRSYADDQYDKFDVPIEAASAARGDTPLAAIYLLENASKFSIDRLLGVEAAEAVFANTYRGSYISAVSNQKNHWEAALRLVRNTPVYRVYRNWGLANLDSELRRLMDHAVEGASAGADVGRVT